MASVANDPNGNFVNELTCLLNKYSKENGSNTPDYILANYLIQQLAAWNLAVRAREEWHGRKFSSGSLNPSDDRESDEPIPTPSQLNVCGPPLTSSE